jgi:hypothetical protein
VFRRVPVRISAGTSAFLSESASIRQRSPPSKSFPILQPPTVLPLDAILTETDCGSGWRPAERESACAPRVVAPICTDPVHLLSKSVYISISFLLRVQFQLILHCDAAGGATGRTVLLFPVPYLPRAHINSKVTEIQSVPHRKHITSPLQSQPLMLFGETVAVYCENHTEHTDTLCGQNTEFVPHRKHIMSPLLSPTG